MLNVLKTMEAGLYARVIFYMDILIPAFGFALLYAGEEAFSTARPHEGVRLATAVAIEAGGGGVG